MAMYSMRSERAFCERLNYDLLFKWFLDMRIDQRAFDATTFSKNRKRLLEHEEVVEHRLCSVVVALSGDHDPDAGRVDQGEYPCDPALALRQRQVVDAVAHEGLGSLLHRHRLFREARSPDQA